MDMFHPDDVETSVEAEVSKKKKAIDSLHSFLDNSNSLFDKGRIIFFYPNINRWGIQLIN